MLHLKKTTNVIVHFLLYGVLFYVANLVVSAWGEGDYTYAIPAAQADVPFTGGDSGGGDSGGGSDAAGGSDCGSDAGGWCDGT